MRDMPLGTVLTLVIATWLSCMYMAESFSAEASENSALQSIEQLLETEFTNISHIANSDTTNPTAFTIIDERNLSEHGAITLPYPENQHLVFGINNNAAKQTKQNLNSKPLKLAKRTSSP